MKLCSHIHELSKQTAAFITIHRRMSGINGRSNILYYFYQCSGEQLIAQ